ncbi:MAG: PP2C family protein-serine/threonine phosphatase [Candidatus Acidiferrales bacterium]
MRAFWRRMSQLDRIGVGLFLFYLLNRILRAMGGNPPFSGALTFLFFLTLAYFFVRLLPWLQRTLLWSLRNRLIVAYIFIAVVPVVLLIIMVAVSSYLTYLQLGAHLLNDDIQEKITEVSEATESIAEAVLNDPFPNAAADPRTLLSHPSIVALLRAERADVPGMVAEILPDDALLQRIAGPGSVHFAGMVQVKDRLWLRGIAKRQLGVRQIVISVAAPLSSEILDGLTSELGPVQLTTLRLARNDLPQPAAFDIEGRRMLPAETITSRRRASRPKARWYDIQVDGASTLEAVALDPDSGAEIQMPVLASFSVRSSQLNHRLFTSLGAFSDSLVVLLALIGIIFFLIEGAALVTGVILTRTITHAVDDLYNATGHIRRGDFGHRVRVERRDQLGVLAESFNAMTSSISELIEEQRQRQKLENEISIAREVQEQLFPQRLPTIPGVDVAAICRPARMVSGDYYDFIPLGSSRLGLVIADISGKGISAALLMASLQAALRSQALLDGQLSTAELVSRLNRHLFYNTSDDRYATLFYSVYDTASHTLSYTNAGHVAPFYILGDQARKLDEGGTVVGLFDDCPYQQGIIHIDPGGVLVAFSDGLTEPENVYGEEFGTDRLVQEALRHRDRPPKVLAENVLDAVEQWAGTQEQADDMTVIVARMN